MITSLKQRLTVFLIFPVALLLLLAGVFSFIYTTESLLDEWKEKATLELQRAAHYIDMRLSRPMEWIEMFHKTGSSRDRVAVQEFFLEQLGKLDGVSHVSLKWADSKPASRPMMGHEMHGGGEPMMPSHQSRFSYVSPPRFDDKIGQETVTLISELQDDSSKIIGRVEVSLRFAYLMQDIKKMSWWQSEKACLVDDSGKYLAHTDEMMKGRHRLGENGDPVEMAVLAAMKENSSGTVLGSGYPPHLVSGYYRIMEAPWVIILFAPGEKILSPVIKFGLQYAFAGFICIAVVLLLIRLIGGGMVRTISEISRAASQVAKGNYGNPLATRSTDEVGQLVRSFNTMVEGLKERDFISNTFGRYVDQEIAKELMKRPGAGRLGGEKREVAILMSDIRDFTPIMESLSPETVVTILNHYFSHMIEVIQGHRGIIVDFFGDGVLVFFDHFEEPIGPVIYRSMQCALAMQARMVRFNAQMSVKNLPEIKMGIGVNSGEVVVGNIGSEARAKYGIVGSAVNITQRIQSLAQGGEIVISDAVYRHLDKEIIIDKSLTIPLKGFQEDVRLHFVRGMKRMVTI